jgi:hypothetical protein
MLQFKVQPKPQATESACRGTAHLWQDLALNLGKLSLAGLFVTGTVWFMGTYA